MKIVGARRLAAVMALGLATSLVAAPSLAATVTLKLVMVSHTDGMQKYYEDLIAAFEKVNPDIKVELSLLASSEIGRKVRALIASGNSPDIVNSDEFSGEAAAGLLLQADQIISAATLKDILPVFMKNSEFNGVAYALPDLASARAFFYNKDILAGAGVKKAPTTWTELEVAAKAIKKKYPKVYPIGLPLGAQGAQEEFTIWGGGNGGRLYNRATGKYTLNTPAYLTTLKFLKKLVDQKFTQPNPGKTNRTGAFKLFAKGKVAMVNGDLFFPNWLSKHGGENIDWGAGALPHAPGKIDITLGVSSYFKGYKANGRQVEIKKFLDFIFIPENYQGFLSAAGGFIPVTASGGKVALADPIIEPYIKLLPRAIFEPESIGSWQACKEKIVGYMGTSMVGNNQKQVLENMQLMCDMAMRDFKGHSHPGRDHSEHDH